ncbi:MAG: CopD family protein, partial [Bradyrhizobium sp.]
MTALLLVLPYDALAHAIIVSSQPASGATIDTSTIAIRLRFNSRIDHARSRLRLRAPDGAEQVLTPAADAPADEIDTEAKALSPGAWHLQLAGAQRRRPHHARRHPVQRALASVVPAMALLLDIFGYLSVVLRGLTLLAQSFTIGGIAFQQLLLRPLQDRLSADALVVGKRAQRVLRRSAFGWFALVVVSLAVNMAALTGTLDLSLREAAGADFVRSGMAVAACALGIALLVRTGTWVAWRAAALVGLAALALAMQLNLTHAASRLDVRWSLLAADVLHMLGAGVWIGGLPFFLMALNGCKAAGDQRLIGRRYSLMSMAAVAAIVLGGTVMVIAYLGSLEALYGTAYGVMTSAKVAMLLMLLALGAGNYLAVERLRRRDPAAPVLRLKRFVEVELG